MTFSPICRPAVAFASLALVLGCNPTEVTNTLSSLRGSSAMSMVCLGWDGTTEFTFGHTLADCPDTRTQAILDVRDDARRFFGLLTQPETGEVAVIDMYDAQYIRGASVARRDPVVTDLERSIPAFNFLTVGAEPVDIVSTPGGVASFVGVAEPLRPGIFALPSTCIGQRIPGTPLRDIATWPSCRLESAPGAMAMYVDTDGVNVEATNGDTLCPGDVNTEQLPVGRRVLLVAMPETGELLTFDAQQLLNVEPGSFEPCEPIGRFDLNGMPLPTRPPPQRVPEDLGDDFIRCLPRPYERGPVQQRYDSRPADIAMDGTLAYIADLETPLIHRIDVSVPEAPVSTQPLYPTSALEPTAVVTTRKVAVSPMTFGGRQYAYAIDGSVEVGTIMAFEVGPGETQQTPIIRTRSAFNPDSPPDRISFGQEVADVDFARGDAPLVDAATGVGVDGIACEPDPALDGSAGAAHRPTDDGQGADNNRLRGTTAFAALYTGQVTLIDVEDLDAPCRRPRSINPTAIEDFRGCVSDGHSTELVSGGVPTVTDELSCNVVQPHRPRLANLFENSTETLAVAMRQFPRLLSSTGRSLPTDQTEEGRNTPKLLGVHYPGRDRGNYPDLWIGAARYSADPADAADDLVLDPRQAERNNVTVSFHEPRAFRTNAAYTVEYEGALGGVRTADIVRDEQGRLNLTSGNNSEYCRTGVQDRDAARRFGERFLSDEVADRQELLDRFAQRYGDYVLLLSDFPDEDNAYWATGEDRDVEAGPGSTCGEFLEADLPGYAACQRYFGSSRAQPLLATRALRVVEAYDEQLVLESEMDLTPGQRESHRRLVQCCFPEAVQFEIHASRQWIVSNNATGLRHDMRVASACDDSAACGCSDDGAPRCVHDENPLRRDLTARVLEISCSDACEAASDGRPPIGVLGSDDLPVCVVDDPSEVALGNLAPECVYRGNPVSFALYRGRERSVAGMNFNWQFSGGFGIAAANLFNITNSPAVPTSIHFVPEIRQMIVTDGGRNGVDFLPYDFLDTSSVRSVPYSVLATRRTPHEPAPQ